MLCMLLKTKGLSTQSPLLFLGCVLDENVAACSARRRFRLWHGIMG